MIDTHIIILSNILCLFINVNYVMKTYKNKIKTKIINNQFFVFESNIEGRIGSLGLTG